MNKLSRFLLLTVGSVFFALSICLFLEPGKLAAGGISGIAIIFNAVTGFNTGIFMFMCNVPLLAVGLRKFGRKFLIYTIYSMSVSSLLIDITNYFFESGFPIIDSLFANSLLGGILMGLALGLVFAAGGSTGGTDIIVKSLQAKNPRFNTGFFYLIIDTVIILASVFVFHSIKIAIFAGISLSVSCFILDIVLFACRKISPIAL